MWWGGFSESLRHYALIQMSCLNPHVVGRFFRALAFYHDMDMETGLNPHVVGRFFRESKFHSFVKESAGLNPHVVGMFFRVLFHIAYD